MSAGCGGLTTSEIARRIRRGHRCTVALLRSLERDGLVVQEHLLWRLSAEGEKTYGALLRKLWPVRDEADAA